MSVSNISDLLSWQSVITSQDVIDSHEKLLFAITWRRSDAVQTIQQILAAPNDFPILMSTPQEVEEVAKRMPEFEKELFFVHGQILERNRRVTEAFANYKKSAEKGFARAQTNLGLCYLQGRGVTVDKKEAYNWLFKSAQQDHKRAQLNLALMLERADGVPADLEKAKFWRKKAEEQDPTATTSEQKKVGGEQHFAKGCRLEKDENYAEAFSAFQAGAKEGYLHAKERIASYYLRGRGVAADKKQAHKYFLEAANAGHARSMYNLAVMLELGDGIPKDINRAHHWYKEAATQGNKQAQERLQSWQAAPKPSSESSLVPLLATLTYSTEDVECWNIDPHIQPKLDRKEAYRLIPAEAKDLEKVATFYLHHPVEGCDIKSVEVIYNPTMESAFTCRLAMLHHRAKNPSFLPNLEKEEQTAWRKKILKNFKELTKPYKDSNFPKVKLLPAWHGTKRKLLDSIFKVGFANLATTDAGFFGKGLYSTYEAEYAYRVYSKETDGSKGALILNWVAVFSPFPVIQGDMDKLAGKGSYANYDSHLAPVAPITSSDKDATAYLPCTTPDQPPTYHEIVVFESASCLPRYLVELQPSMPKALVPKIDRKPSKSIVEKKKKPASAKK